MGKTSILVLSAALFGALVACDSGTGKTGAATATATASASGKAAEQPASSAAVKDASKACEEYVKALEECIAKQEGDAKKTWQTELDEHKKAFAEAPDAAKAQLEKACVTGILTVKQGCE